MDFVGPIKLKAMSVVTFIIRIMALLRGGYDGWLRSKMNVTILLLKDTPRKKGEKNEQ